MKIDFDGSVFFAVCTFEERLTFKKAGWVFHPIRKRWETTSLALADHFFDVAEGQAFERLSGIRAVLNEKISASLATETDTQFWSPEGKNYLDFQRAGIEGILSKQDTLLADEPGLGKGQRETDRVFTPNGWVTIKNLKVGDKVFSSDGLPYLVTGKFDRGLLSTYKITFSDGDSLIVDGDHIWKVKRRNYNNKSGVVTSPPWKEINTKTLFELAGTQKFLTSQFRIPLTTVDLPQTSLPIDPYILGVLIGDGGIKHSVILSSADSEILNKVRERLPKDCDLRHISKYDYGIRRRDKTNSVRDGLKILGLFGFGSDVKFIPKSYLLSSIDQRKELLFGLMDTDGYVNKDGSTIQYSTNSKELARNVKELVNSLGQVAWVSSKISASGKTHYTVTIRTEFNPFYVTRKAKRYISCTPHRIIKSVEIADIEHIYCISVASPDHTYVTENFIVTHNTIQAIGVINNDRSLRKTLIIVPASLQKNWMRELKYWCRDDLKIGMTRSRVVKDKDTGKSKTQHLWPDSDIVITTYDMLEAYTQQVRSKVWDFMVTDESHLITNPNTIRSRQVFGGGRGRKHVTPIPRKKTLFITGTPILNKPVDLWVFCKACDPRGLGSDYIKFIKRYCGAYEDHFGWFKDGATNLEELQNILRSTFMIRRLKKDVLKELPPKFRKVVELPAEGAKKVVKKELKIFSDNLSGLVLLNQDQRFDEEELAMDVSIDTLISFVDKATEEAQDYEDYRMGKADLEDYMKLHFEAMASSREEVGLAKVPMVLEYVNTLLETEEKVVIMAVHKGVAEALREAYSDCAFVTGSVPPNKRQNEVDKFQSDPKCRVFIGNIDAAGVGLTLTASSNLVFAELGWVPASMEQAEDRIHRIGQTSNAVIHYLVLSQSLEAAVVEKLIEKQEIIDKTLNVNENS